MPSEYDAETRERVVRLFHERREAAPTESFLASFRRVRELNGIPGDTMRGWVTKAQIEAGERPGTSSSERGEIRRLKPENAELRRANEILKTASAFCGSGARPPYPVIVAYIDVYKIQFGAWAELPRALPAWSADRPEHLLRP